MDRGGVLRPPYEIASLVWQWGWQNLATVSGRMLLAGRRWTELSADEFYAVVYTLMLEEAGSRSHLEETLKTWADERKILSTGAPADVAWADADARALANLAKME